MGRWRIIVGLAVSAVFLALLLTNVDRREVLDAVADVNPWWFVLATPVYTLGIWVRGSNRHGQQIERKIAIVTDDDGPATPSCPAILLARKLLLGPGLPPGAYPCMGHLRLDEILAHLRPLGIWCARDP